MENHPVVINVNLKRSSASSKRVTVIKASARKTKVVAKRKGHSAQ